MTRIRRSTRAAVWPVVLTLLAACGPGRDSRPIQLTDEEQRLVQETVQMIRIRLETTRDPKHAAEMRAAADGLYTEEERQFLLDRLATDSARGEVVMDAIHDSLQAMRAELFVPTSP
jgi:hypothetical protein